MLLLGEPSSRGPALRCVGCIRHDYTVGTSFAGADRAVRCLHIPAPEAASQAALVWFGVILCVNMQTSFMHPPFGFALFYLRGVAPKEVKSADIYWGALPWLGLQIIMVILVALLPGMVTGFVDKGVASGLYEGLHI